MRLLLVDDDTALAASISRLLRHRFGAEVVVVHDGLMALELVRRDGAFEAAIVDLDLPHLDGARLVDELASVAPAIAAGLWSASPELFDVKAENAAFRLQKSHDAGALLATVERLLVRKRRAANGR